MRKVQPLPADQIDSSKPYEIPELVIVLINNMLREVWDNGSAILFTKDIMQKLKLVFNKTEQEILQMHWLDIEPIYRKAGYNVEYIKPAYGEQGDSYFKFENQSIT